MVKEARCVGDLSSKLATNIPGIEEDEVLELARDKNMESLTFSSPVILRRLIGFLILDHLSNQEAHGYELWRKIENDLDLKIPHPVIYKILREFEEYGLVRSRWLANSSGPAKKVYSLTNDGKMILKHNLELLRRIRKLLDRVIEHVEKI